MSCRENPYVSGVLALLRRCYPHVTDQQMLSMFHHERAVARRALDAGGSGPLNLRGTADDLAARREEFIENLRLDVGADIPARITDRLANEAPTDALTNRTILQVEHSARQYRYDRTYFLQNVEETLGLSQDEAIAEWDRLVREGEAQRPSVRRGRGRGVVASHAMPARMPRSAGPIHAFEVLSRRLQEATEQADPDRPQRAAFEDVVTPSAAGRVRGVAVDTAEGMILVRMNTGYVSTLRADTPLPSAGSRRPDPHELGPRPHLPRPEH
jgi:hypothetical protein